MFRLVYTTLFLIFFTGFTFAQIPGRQDHDLYPANNTPETKREAIFAGYFEDTNVGNMHVYVPAGEVEPDYFFKGKELSRGLFGIFDPRWRDELSGDFQAYAVYSIRGEGKPYYIIRFAGDDMDPMIALFEMANNKLHHKVTLASNWCTDQYCVQKDSWLQDFDGDVRLDVLTKVKTTDDRRKNQVIDTYYTILRQTQNGAFAQDSKMDVDVNDYFMQEDME